MSPKKPEAELLDKIAVFISKDVKGEKSVLMRYLEGRGWWYPSLTLERGAQYLDVVKQLLEDLNLQGKPAGVKKVQLYNCECMKAVALIYDVILENDDESNRNEAQGCRWFNAKVLDDLETNINADDSLIEPSAYHFLNPDAEPVSTAEQMSPPKNVEAILTSSNMQVRHLQMVDFHHVETLRKLHMHFASLCWPATEMTFEAFSGEFPLHSVSWWYAFNVNNRKRLSFYDYLSGHAMASPRAFFVKDLLTKKVQAIFRFYVSDHAEYMSARQFKLLITDVHMANMKNGNQGSFAELSENVRRSVKLEPDGGVTLANFMEAAANNYLPNISNLARVDYDLIEVATETAACICKKACMVPDHQRDEASRTDKRSNGPEPCTPYGQTAHNDAQCPPGSTPDCYSQRVSCPAQQLPMRTCDQSNAAGGDQGDGEEGAGPGSNLRPVSFNPSDVMNTDNNSKKGPNEPRLPVNLEKTDPNFEPTIYEAGQRAPPPSGKPVPTKSVDGNNPNGDKEVYVPDDYTPVAARYTYPPVRPDYNGDPYSLPYRGFGERPEDANASQNNRYTSVNYDDEDRERQPLRRGGKRGSYDSNQSSSKPRRMLSMLPAPEPNISSNSSNFSSSNARDGMSCALLGANANNQNTKCNRWLEGIDSTGITEDSGLYYTLGFHVVRLAEDSHQFGLQTTPLQNIGESAYDDGTVKKAVDGTAGGSNSVVDEAGVLAKLAFEGGDVLKSSNAPGGSDQASQGAFSILEMLNDNLTEKQKENGDYIADWTNATAYGVFLEALTKLCKYMKGLMEKEERLLFLNGPVYILGDLHGNYHDARTYERFLWRYGPTLCPAKLLFLGDYCDRGDNQLETIAYLFAQKFIAPNKVFLLRGNHEDPKVNMTSLLPACQKAAEAVWGNPEKGKEIWNAINSAFSAMPLCAVIDNSIFCSHGGIPSPRCGFRMLPDINMKIPALLNSIYDNEMALELTSNDPMRPEHAKIQEVQEDMVSHKDGFAVNTNRSLPQFREKRILFFTTGAMKKFLKKQNLQFVVRAHEVRQRGAQIRQGLKMLTVHGSIRNLGTNELGDATVLLADDSKLRVIRVAVDAQLQKLRKDPNAASENKADQMAPAVTDKGVDDNMMEQKEILRVIKQFLEAHKTSAVNMSGGQQTRRSAAAVMAEIQQRMLASAEDGGFEDPCFDDDGSVARTKSMETITASTVDVSEF